MGRLTAPWWVFVAVFVAGGVAWHFVGAAPSDAAMDELRREVAEKERARVVAEARADSAARIADAALEDHAALVQRSDSTISTLTQRIQATTARATEISTEIRAQVDSETAGLLTELEAEWQATLDAERAQTDVWRTRALSAEAGWQDERLARVAAEETVEAMEESFEAQAGLVRALEAQVARARRDKRILALAGIAGVAWGLTR